MTDTDVTPDLDQLTGLDFTPACDNSDNHPATHAVTWKCGCIELLCTPCTNNTRKWISRHWQFTWCKCRKCGTEYHNGCTHQLITRISPL